MAFVFRLSWLPILMTQQQADGNGASPLLASLATLLPPEVWDNVLRQLSARDLQHTALALSRALPSAGVRLEHLFTAVRVTRDQLQANQLVRRIGPRFADAELAKSLATSFANVAWRTDSQLLVNLVIAFPHLRTIDLHVGPLFAPEHLEELLEKPRPVLKRLAMRFNPYVDRAAYTIFLKGLYFDTGLLKMAKWPLTPDYTDLSLVQDPIPSHRDLVAAAFEAGTAAPKQAHAQPIVFFKLSCLSTLATAPISSFLTHVKIRIPNRIILTAISTASTSSTVIPATHSATLPKPFPALEHLDISTTYVGCDGAFQGLLKRHPGLRHLVVDRSGLIRSAMSEDLCQEIGKVIATIGVARATEATKVYRTAARALQERARAAEARRQADQAQLDPQQQAIQNVVDRDVARSSRRGRSAYATERRPRGAQVGVDAAAVASLNDALASLAVSSAVKKPIILPAAPSLLSLCCGPNEHDDIDDEMRTVWEEDFAEGYEEGLEHAISQIEDKLSDFRRLDQRARNATARSPAEDRIFPQLMRFRTPEERKERIMLAKSLGCSVEDLDGEGEKDIFSTLDLVECDVADAMHLKDQIKSSQCTLCTVADCAGQGRIAFTDDGEYERKAQARWRKGASEHKTGCGHLLGRQIWEDAD